jgi:sulfur carrier protein ThiS
MKLFTGGYLTFYMPQQKHLLEIHLHKPTQLKEILAGLRIPIAEVDLTAVNGNLADVEEVIVEDTDVVRVFSSVNGG